MVEHIGFIFMSYNLFEISEVNFCRQIKSVLLSFIQGFEGEATLTESSETKNVSKI